MQYLDSLVARAMNAALGRFEAFWATDGSYSAVEPLEPRDVVAKTAYALANPVAAGLVRRSSEWPGLWTAPQEIGEAKVVARRPESFFDPNGHMPELVELELTAPPGFASAEEFRRLVSAEHEILEANHRQERAAQGRGFLGVDQVLAHDPFARPPGGESRFGLKPRIAAREKGTRDAGLLRLVSFLRAYRQAWNDRKGGIPDVVFPAGTYLLRILHGVQCAGAT